MIGLLTTANSYATDALVAAAELPLAAVDVSGLGLPPYRCPYGLPPVASGDVVLVVSSWLRQLQGQGFAVVEQALLPLRRRFARVVGLDQADSFQLDFSDDVLSHLDAVLKVNGVYRDRDLYNFIAGAPTPDGCWTAKIKPRPRSYSPLNLDKIHLSIPCFLGVSLPLRMRTRPFHCKLPVQRVARNVADRLLESTFSPLKAARPPRRTVHFFASLTHIQRAAAARLLRDSNLSWSGGITGVPEHVGGWNGDGIAALTPDERQTLAANLARQDILAAPLGRWQYRKSMLDCKAVLSITGYGEVCFRMAEAWAARRVLVCQEMAHAETLFPLRPGRNVVYCKPDLSDLRDVLEDIEADFPRYVDIAEQGYHDWQKWSQQYRDVVRAGFAPLYE